jgi:hypothetical protein
MVKNAYWLKQEKIFLNAIKRAKVPNASLSKVAYIRIKKHADIDKIPTGGGCYWIWTNEPVIHTLHKHELPKPFNHGEIIYNGIAKDDVKGRIFHHLFGYEDAGWSGISVDIYTNKSISHRKKACSKKGKVPFLELVVKGVRKYEAIQSKDLLLKMKLCTLEKRYLQKNKTNTFYFRNGINITEPKHRKYDFKVYFITGLTSLYLEHIEKEWRKNGLPRLCSYSTGR